MKTEKREAVSQDRWEKFKSLQKVGVVWLELDEFGHVSCSDTVGQGDAVSSGLAFKIINTFSNKLFPRESLKDSLRRSGRVALLAKKQENEADSSDIGEALLKLIELQGELPEDGILYGTAMLVPGRHGATDDWFSRTISAAERWASPRSTKKSVATTSESVAELHKESLPTHTPDVAQTERTKEGLKRPEDELARAEPQKGTDIDLERAFFSQGPDVAEARFVHLAAAMAAKYPKRKESIKARVVAAIDGGHDPVEAEPRAVSPSESEKLAHPQKEDELLPRTGHFLIENFASLWHNRNVLARTEFVAKFQKILNEIFITKNTGSYENNVAIIRWVNFISKSMRIELKFNSSKHDNESVRIRYKSNGNTGSFDLREAAGDGAILAETGTREFHQLSVHSHTGRNPVRP